MREPRVPRPSKRYSDCVDPEGVWEDQNNVEASTQPTQKRATVKQEPGAKRRTSASQGTQRTPLQPQGQPRGVAVTPVQDGDAQEDSQACDRQSCLAVQIAMAPFCQSQTHQTGPGPSSQQQRQRQQKQQQQAQPSPGDVQWLEARVSCGMLQSIE
eukprot:72653-Pelagomonas_calceolata.AAC.2